MGSRDGVGGGRMEGWWIRVRKTVEGLRGWDGEKESVGVRQKKGGGVMKVKETEK